MLPPAMTRALPAAALALCLAACTSPSRRIPFQYTSGWRAWATGGQWLMTSDAFADEADVYGFEVLIDEPGSGGWAGEMGFRYAEGDGEGNRTIPSGAIVPAEREVEWYELSFGVRQIFRPDERFQPYVGVGGVFAQERSTEFYNDPPGGTDQTDHERGEILPGISGRMGILWNILRDQIREDYQVPVAFDVRGMYGVDFSYVEVTLSVGFGK
jgi:hypothetical protein